MSSQRRAKRGAAATAPVKPPTITPPPSLITATISGQALWFSLGLIVLNLIVYSALRTHPFFQFDDPGYVTENPHITSGLTLQNIIWAFTSGYFANWHPLTWISHMLDVQLFGMNAPAHHLTNLFFHIVATVLLFGFLHSTTGAPGRSAFVAALFAAHPAHVESVAWIAERKDVLSALFWMLTLWAYVSYIRQPSRNRYVLIILAFACGLMSKPMLVTLPFALLLLDVWPLGRMKSAREVNQLVIEKVPLFALSAAASVITFVVQQQAGAVQQADRLGLDVRLGNALLSYATYIGKMIWPAWLGVFYPYARTLPAGQMFVSFLVLGLISAGVLIVARRLPYVPVGWFWFLGTLVPVIGLVQVGEQSMADRYTYIPYIGLFIILSWGAAEILSRSSQRAVLLPAAASVVILACVITAKAQVEYWKDSVSLWQHTVDVTKDNYIAENNLGFAYKEAGKLDEAITHYDASVQIRPTYALAQGNLAQVLADKGRVDEAIVHYKESLRFQPKNVLIRTFLGLAFVKKGDLDSGIAEYNEALSAMPDFAFTHSSLGTALLKKGNIDDAIKHFTESLRIDPNSAEVHNNLGVAFVNQGKTKEAIDQFSESVRIKPDYAVAQKNLAMARQNQPQSH